MSDFSEKENSIPEESNPEENSAVYEDEYAGFETVFSDPSEHKDKKPVKSGKKRIVTVIAAALAVAVLVGGTLAIIKLIPEKQDEDTQSSLFESIKVIDRDVDKISEMTLTNEHGTVKFISEKVVKESESTDENSSGSSSEPETETVWHIDGLAPELVSTSKISSVVSNAAAITALRSIDTKTASDCGMDDPKIKIEVKDSDGGYIVLVGDDSPDGTGVYLACSTDDKIYIVEESAVSSFDYELLDYADAQSFAAVTSDNSAYMTEEGVLQTFDSLTVNGKNFEKPAVFVPNKDELLSSYVAYIVKSSDNRTAENVDTLFKLFSEGLTVSGAYSYDVSPTSLASVGLDSPDMTVTLDVAGKQHIFKIAKVDESYCAVINSDSKMISKVSASDLPFVDYKTEDFYASWVYIRSINDISNFKLTENGVTYSFDIVYDDTEGAEEPYVITYNGKKITASNFQSFYQEFVSLSCNDFTVESLSEAPSVTVDITYTAGGSTKLEFTKCSATKYQYSVDKKAFGRVTSAAMNKVLKYVKYAAEDKEIKN